jgi:hypothetical protein
MKTSTRHPTTGKFVGDPHSAGRALVAQRVKAQPKGPGLTSPARLRSAVQQVLKSRPIGSPFGGQQKK